MAKLHDLGVAEAAKAIRTGEIKAEALADALLARAAAHKSLNAFIALEPDKVRAAAREADRKRARPPGWLVVGCPFFDEVIE